MACDCPEIYGTPQTAFVRDGSSIKELKAPIKRRSKEFIQASQFLKFSRARGQAQSLFRLDDPSVIAWRENAETSSKSIADTSIATEANAGLSEAIGSLILASMASKGRLTLDKQSDAQLAKIAASQLLDRSLGIISAVGQLKQLQYPGGKFNLSENGTFIAPFQRELVAQVCISEQYKQEVFKLLHEELRHCLRHEGSQGSWGKLSFVNDKYVVELSI
jgi:hypothetical protein